MNRFYKLAGIFLIVLSSNPLFADYSGQGIQTINNGIKVRYIDPLFEEVDIEKNIVYGSQVNEKGETEELRLDIYSPSGDRLKKRPVIVWFHGGGFTFGNDKSQGYIVKMANLFAQKGYVCVSVDYRLRAKPFEDISGTLFDAVSDAAKSIEWIKRNREKLKIDVSRMIVGGGSAGGILACNLCLNDHAAFGKREKKGLLALVNLWGSPNPDWGSLDVDKNDPPVIIVHGTDDKLVSFTNSENLISKLSVAGVDHELIRIEGGGHTPVGYMGDFEKRISGFLYARLNLKN